MNEHTSKMVDAANLLVARTGCKCLIQIDDVFSWWTWSEDVSQMSEDRITDEIWDAASPYAPTIFQITITDNGATATWAIYSFGG